MAIGETAAFGLVRKWVIRLSAGRCPYCNTRSSKIKIKVVPHQAMVPRAPYDPTVMHVTKHFTHVDCRKGPCKKYWMLPFTSRTIVLSRKEMIAKARKKFEASS